MRQLMRKPLTWMIAAEVIVVAALAAVSWQFIATQRVSAGPPLVLRVTSPEPDATPDIPADALAPPSPTAIPLLPGLNVDPRFWQQRLQELNGAQAQFEALEWRLVSSAVDSMERYIKTVVLPSVERAESSTGGKA